MQFSMEICADRQFCASPGKAWWGERSAEGQRLSTSPVRLRNSGALLIVMDWCPAFHFRWPFCSPSASGDFPILIGDSSLKPPFFKLIEATIIEVPMTFVPPSQIPVADSGGVEALEGSLSAPLPIAAAFGDGWRDLLRTAARHGGGGFPSQHVVLQGVIGIPHKFWKHRLFESCNLKIFRLHEWWGCLPLLSFPAGSTLARQSSGLWHAAVLACNSFE